MITTEELFLAERFASQSPCSAEEDLIAKRDLKARIDEIGSYRYINPVTGRVIDVVPFGAPPGYKHVHVSMDTEGIAAARTEPEAVPARPTHGRYSDRPDRPDPAPGDAPGVFSDGPMRTGPRGGGFGRRGPT